ncbi:MAG: hypothetical protein SVV80_03935 [Planctomycetota bacterium]|nr:hypothetical protein [Planctomycetota bacterium]
MTAIRVSQVERLLSPRNFPIFFKNRQEHLLHYVVGAVRPTQQAVHQPVDVLEVHRHKFIEGGCIIPLRARRRGGIDAAFPVKRPFRGPVGLVGHNHTH